MTHVHALLFFFFFKAEEIYNVAAAITFDSVDEGSNNSRRGDLALGFEQRSDLQDAGLHPKAAGYRHGSVWPCLRQLFLPLFN